MRPILGSGRGRLSAVRRAACMTVLVSIVLQTSDWVLCQDLPHCWRAVAAT